jgi:uncharacterized membrane protein YqiK
MIKLTILIASLAIFFLVLVLYVVPNQGAFIVNRTATIGASRCSPAAQGDSANSGGEFRS